MNKSWINKLKTLANSIANFSKDPNTKVGAIIFNDDFRILSIGYNGVPQGVEDTHERYQPPLKYKYIEHAERNAIYTAASEGIRLKDTNILLNNLFSCPDCARAIVQSKIKCVIAPKPNSGHLKYGEDFKISLEILKEANIEIIYT